jgi:hypothetical protein
MNGFNYLVIELLSTSVGLRILVLVFKVAIVNFV